jgi:hypothetical protein
MRKRHFGLWLLFFVAGLLAGCGGDPDDMAAPPANTSLPPRPPITLQPTFTPLPTAGPLPSITPPPPRPTAVPNTPIPFDETVVELRYRIPALGLDRRLQGNVAGSIIVVDEANGLARQRSNQAGILLELRSVLPTLSLALLPDDCPACVHVTFALPAQSVTGDGWLQDPVLLASIENYLAVGLGPHFPPNTVIGLRRAASPYAPAYTLSLAADGRAQGWLATEPQVDPPSPADPARVELELLAALPLAELRNQYVADCPGRPLETFTLQSGDDDWSGTIRCPELSLSPALLPLYLRLSDIVAERTAPVSLPQPEPLFPLEAFIVYQRADGTSLTLFHDGALLGVAADGLAFSGALTTTLPISLTQSVINSNLLQPGYRTFLGETAVSPTPPQTSLAARGPNGVLDGRWATPPAHPIFATLNQLLGSLINATIEPTVEGDIVPATDPDTDAAPPP